MFFVWVVVAAVVLFAVAALVVGRGGGLAPAERDEAGLDLPPGQLGPADVEALRLGVGLRGYRMDEVDQVLDRLAAELARRDAALAALSAQNAALRAQVDAAAATEEG